MSKNASCLAAALVIVAAPGLTTPAKACNATPRSASLCTVVPQSAQIRDKPDGHVEYIASGKVVAAGRSGNDLWVNIEVPCAGYKGWIASRDLTCESASASAQVPAKP